MTVVQAPQTQAVFLTTTPDKVWDRIRAMSIPLRIVGITKLARAVDHGPRLVRFAAVFNLDKIRKLHALFTQTAKLHQQRPPIPSTPAGIMDGVPRRRAVSSAAKQR